MSASTRESRDTGPLVSVATIVAASAVTALATFALTRTLNRRQLDKVHRLRHEERTGRIRAEVRLRTALKDLQQQHNNGAKENPPGSLDNGEADSAANTSTVTQMTLRSIGVVVSPFAKRMGTPRQPQLVPSARGYIEFSVPPSCLDGIEEYSHVWVIFEFHANTNASANHGRQSTSSSSFSTARTKIRPPRAPHKVGQLATRSPHRPNPLGLSLVTVDKWDSPTRRLHVSSLDLVAGTPVHDVKPFVPWDVPGFVSHPDVVSSLLGGSGVVKVPSWVIQEDQLARVQFDAAAAVQLRECVEAGRLAPLYNAQNGGIKAAQSLLVEILQQDPRSSHRGLKENQRGSAEPSPVDYTMIIGQCQVSFAVAASGVTVTKIAGVELDPDTTIYAEGIPLLMTQSKQ
jgi:tRNA-Thr(GGU) m(6)t(6)A37 methyltransferase TsaA